MRMTTRSRVGQELNDSFDETRDPDKRNGLADDKAFMRSLRTKRPDSLTIQEIRKTGTIALTGIDFRENFENVLAGLYRKKAESMVQFDEESTIQIISEIQLLESLMVGE